MKRSPDSEPQPSLPKHLLADSEDERLFVIHLESPRFVGEVVPAAGDTFEILPAWIDAAPAEEEATAALQDAADFYLRMVEWEEEEEGDAY